MGIKQFLAASLSQIVELWRDHAEIVYDTLHESRSFLRVNICARLGLQQLFRRFCSEPSGILWRPFKRQGQAVFRQQLPLPIGRCG